MCKASRENAAGERFPVARTADERCVGALIRAWTNHEDRNDRLIVRAVIEFVD